MLPVGAGGRAGSSVRRIRTLRIPSRAAANAVARAWFDCSPPQVMTWVASWACASAIKYSSFRILLPITSAPVWSSRFIQSRGPSPSP
jgi:hypothetical protein